MASTLIPLKYPIAGCIILGCLFFFSVQQVCISPISERPKIFHRYLAVLYCFNTWVLSCVLISHYQHPDNITLTICTQCFVAWVIICGFFPLSGIAIRGVEAAHKAKRSTSKSSNGPLWFSNGMKAIVYTHTVVIVAFYILAYSYSNAIFFTYYYIFLDVLCVVVFLLLFRAIIKVLVGLATIIKSAKQSLTNTIDDNNKTFDEYKITQNELDKARRRIRCELNLKDSQFIYEQQNEAASIEVIKIITDAVTLTAPEVEQVHNLIRTEQQGYIKIDKLRKAQRSMRWSVVFLTVACIYTVYHLVQFVAVLKYTTLPIHASPFPTVTSCIGHFIFDVAVDLALIFASYRRSNWCKDISANSCMYICCPILDLHGKSDAYLDNINKTIDINGNPLAKNEEETQQLSSPDPEETQITEMIPTVRKNYSVTPSVLLNLPSITVHRVASLNPDGIRVVIYNFKNALWTVHEQGEYSRYDMSMPFGDSNRVAVLKQHFEGLLAHSVELCVISMHTSEVTKQMLQRAGLSRYFAADYVIGINHELLENATNHEYSLNEKLLKIIQKTQCINDSVLYIDSDGYTLNIEKMNLCRTYGVKIPYGLRIHDLNMIHKKYFVFQI
eukprot:1057164_1